MKAFVDTSTLLKKYLAEKGSDDFIQLLEEVTEIIVAPLCPLEIHSALRRRMQEKSLTKAQRDWILKEFNIDFHHFYVVKWNERLQHKAVEYINSYHLKTLDSIQLSSASLAKADIFITSDVKLYEYATKEFESVQLI